MSMLDYLTKKSKKLASFKKLDELKEKAQKMVSDQIGATAEFDDYFENKYPGIETELCDVFSNQIAYHRAVLLNELLRKSNPKLIEYFDKIDDAYLTDRIVQTGAIEKYTNPEKYNRFQAHADILRIENLVTANEYSSSNHPELLQYLANAQTINNNFKKLSFKDAVSTTLHDLVMDAIFIRSSINAQYPHINRAIDEYNQQYEYCYSMYEEDTKAGKYKSFNRLKNDKLKTNKYSQLLDKVFDQSIAKTEAEKELQQLVQIKTVQTM